MREAAIFQNLITEFSQRHRTFTYPGDWRPRRPVSPGWSPAGRGRCCCGGAARRRAAATRAARASRTRSTTPTALPGGNDQPINTQRITRSRRLKMMALVERSTENVAPAARCAVHTGWAVLTLTFSANGRHIQRLIADATQPQYRVTNQDIAANLAHGHTADISGDALPCTAKCLGN